MTRSSAYPMLFPIRQTIRPQPVIDVVDATRAALDDATAGQEISAAQSVAIAVGSRGISNLRAIVGETVRFVRALGARPVIIPAMGSHGGASAEGQKAVLAAMGIDESIGCPIEASMDTVVLGKSAHGIEIHFDRNAQAADHIIVINRIKPHTRLTGRWESGLVKMLLIGLGKHRGAVQYHQLFGRQGYRLDMIAPEIVNTIIARVPVTLGLAIVEDAFENTSLIEAVRPGEFLIHEPDLLSMAKARLPRLPFDAADLLIVDRIGKEISGTGMDTNVIGRKSHDKFVAGAETPEIREIYVRALSEKTAGNASGIGIAEYCHRRVIEAMDHDVTRINCVTAGHVTAGAVPVAFQSDREVFDAVIAQIGSESVDQMRWIWITDTLQLEHAWCSQAYWTEAKGRDDLIPLAEPQPLRFSADGEVMLPAVKSLHAR